MKKLPTIYRNTINKNISNNKEKCIITNKIDEKENNIKETIDEIFNTLGYPYNINVAITTINKTYDTYLVARTINDLLTIDNDLISIDDIINIKIKKD